MISGLTMFCDVCHAPAYTAHASCRECLGEFCEAHIVPGSLVEEEGTALCRQCEREGRIAG